MGNKSLQLGNHVLLEMKTDTGISVAELSSNNPVLLVFLRHFGCLFCKEAMIDISKKRNFYEEKGVKVVIAHMSDKETAESYFKEYNLQGIDHVSDPNKKFYSQFGLTKGKLNQLYGLRTLLRGVNLVTTQNIPFTLKVVGDGYQMPGVFVIDDKKVVSQYVHKTVSDRPDYDQLLSSYLGV